MSKGGIAGAEQGAEEAMVGGVAAEVLDAPGQLIVTPHPVLLDGQRHITADPLPGESLADFLARHVPGVDLTGWSVAISGFEVPPELWARTFPRPGQLIACRGAVQKSALKYLTYAALVFVSFGTIGLVIAGAALIVKALKPKVPDSPNYGNAAQVYSLSGQRNQPRQYAPIGTLLGEMRVTPDLAGNPYTWFESDDQYLSTILLGGINVDSYADLAVGDTPLASFSDVAVYTNGFSGLASAAVPLFSNADTIAGGTLEDTTAWVQRTSSVDAVMLQIDLEYQLCRQGDNGLENASLTVQAEYRAVGASAWTAFQSATFVNKTMETRRVTWSRTVTQGQYEVRARRTDGANPDRVTRTVQWTTLRTVQPDDADYSGWGRIGIRIKATGQLSGSLDTLRATFKPRPLPVWDGTAWANATTRPGVSNPGALVLQVLRGIYHGDVLQFGYGLSDDQIDVEGLKGFILHCTANGYTYDRWITEEISLGSLLDEIALAGMGQFMWLDGSRPTVRWAADGQPLAGVVNMANMSRGSFSVSYQLTNAADGIEYQYVDRDRNFETVTLRVMAPGVSTMLNPARLTGQGVTTAAHAARMARYHLAQSLYQYKEIGFGADIERLDYQRMSILSVSHDMTQWGYGGRLLSAATVGGSVVLTLDEPVPSLPSRFIGLRVPGEREYRVFGVQAFSGSSATITLTGTWPAGVPFPGDSASNPAYDTLWCYDVKATPGYRVRVVAIEPDSDLKGATIRCVPESAEFWTYVNTGTYVPAPSQSLIPQLQAPAVSNIRVQAQTNTQGNTDWIQFNVVWDSTGDLDHCQVWAAIDGQPLRLVDAQALGNRSSFRVDENGSWLIQVRPFAPGGQVGAPQSVVYATDAVNRPPPNVDIFAVSEVDAGLRRYRFGYSGATPATYAGVQIRYRAGLTAATLSDWDSMTPLGLATDVYTFATESTLPAAGPWTFACRAISSAGVLASSIKQVSVTLGTTFSDILNPDTTPAPTPTGVEVTAGFASLFFKHDVPTYSFGHGHGKTRVYGVVYTGGAEPAFSSTSLLTEFTGPVGSYPTALGTTWRIWLKWVTKDGYESTTPAGAGGGNGYPAATGLIGGANLAPLSITAAKLAAAAVDLSSDKVTGTITDPARFGAVAVGYTVTQYLLATSGVLGNLVVDNAQIGSVSVTKLLAGYLAVGQYIRSQGYMPGVQGWNINADGSAEFLNLTIRGNSTFDGRVTMRRTDGSIMFQSGGTLSWADITPSTGWLNSYAPISQNLIANSDYTSSITMTSVAQNGASFDVGLQYASNLWPTNYTLIGGTTRNLTCHQQGIVGGGDTVVVADFYPTGGWDQATAIPVIPGQRYCMSAYAQAHRCYVGVCLMFFDVSGNQLSGLIESGPVATNASYADALTQYARPFALAVAPAGSAVCRVAVRKFNTIAGGPAESWFWVAAPQFEAVNANAPGPSPYVAGPPGSTRQLGYTGDLNATLGAVAGTNLKDSGGAVLGDLAVKNSAISVSNTGNAYTINNIGSAGSINLPGLGYSGDLNATYGATIGANLGGNFSQQTWDTVMNGQTLIRASHIQQLTSSNITVTTLSNVINGSVTSSGRVELSTNRIDVYDDSNVRRVRIGLL